ncbi:hypothetical protein ACX92S_08280 [Enterococcus faecalis]
MTIESLGAIAGSVMSIIALVAFFVKPYLDTSKRLDNTLEDLNITIKLLQKDLEVGNEDRKMIHIQLDKHEDRLDRHNERLVEHGEQLKTLFKGRKKPNE